MNRTILLTTLLCIMVFSSVVLASDTYQVTVRPKVLGDLQPSTTFDYEFLFTSDNACSVIYKNATTSITTDQYGIGYTELDMAGITGNPKYLCEIRDGSLRKVHNVSLGFFEDVGVRDDERYFFDTLRSKYLSWISASDWFEFNDNVNIDGNASADYFIGNGSQLTDISASSVSGITITAEWKFDTATADADPGNKKFRLNNAVQGSATYVYVSDTTNSGVDMSNILTTLESGNFIYLQKSNDAGKAILFEVSGTPIDATTYFKIPVTNGQVGDTALSNNDLCGFIMFSLNDGATGFWNETGNILEPATGGRDIETSGDYNGTSPTSDVEAYNLLGRWSVTAPLGYITNSINIGGFFSGTGKINTRNTTGHTIFTVHDYGNVTVSEYVIAKGFVGDGSGLTNLPGGLWRTTGAGDVQLKSVGDFVQLNGSAGEGIVLDGINQNNYIMYDDALLIINDDTDGEITIEASDGTVSLSGANGGVQIGGTHLDLNSFGIWGVGDEVNRIRWNTTNSWWDILTGIFTPSARVGTATDYIDLNETGIFCEGSATGGICTGGGYWDRTGTELSPDTVGDSLFIGNSSGNTTIGSDGTITLYGDARVTNFMEYYAYNLGGIAGTYNSISCNAGGLASLNGIYFKSFDDGQGSGTPEAINFQFVLPASYEAGTDITITFAWTVGTTSTDDVRWQSGFTYLSNGDTYSPSTYTWATPQNVAGPGTAWERQDYSATFSGTGLNQRDIINIVIFRDADNGADDYSGDAYISTAGFEYQMNKLGNGV